jgi:hypothetical protein
MKNLKDLIMPLVASNATNLRLALKQKAIDDAAGDFAEPADK